MDEREKLEVCLHFLKSLKDELYKVEQAGLEYMQFVLLGQTIEVLGSFLDSKPLKAKDQSSKRFAAAVHFLLGGKYRVLNAKQGLYNKLRNQMTHTFTPGGELLLTDRKRCKEGWQHLQSLDSRLVFISEDFFQDIYEAIDRLMELLRDGKVKPKNIAFKYEE